MFRGNGWSLILAGMGCPSRRSSSSEPRLTVQTSVRPGCCSTSMDFKVGGCQSSRRETGTVGGLKGRSVVFQWVFRCICFGANFFFAFGPLRLGVSVSVCCDRAAISFFFVSSPDFFPLPDPFDAPLTGGGSVRQQGLTFVQALILLSTDRWHSC